MAYESGIQSKKDRTITVIILTSESGSSDVLINRGSRALVN